jgi:hypothetical protein
MKHPALVTLRPEHIAYMTSSEGKRNVDAAARTLKNELQKRMDRVIAEMQKATSPAGQPALKAFEIRKAVELVNAIRSGKSAEIKKLAALLLLEYPVGQSLNEVREIVLAA